MREYKIYANSQNVNEAVKQGWSWPAFFFILLWALIKKLWRIVIVVFSLFFVLGFIGVLAGGEIESTINGVISILNFGCIIVFGINGNQWREKNLQSRGYEYKDTVSASNPKGAIALWLKKTHESQFDTNNSMSYRAALTT